MALIRFAVAKPRGHSKAASLQLTSLFLQEPRNATIVKFLGSFIEDDWPESIDLPCVDSMHLTL